jgi:hypothetical protein
MNLKFWQKAVVILGVCAIFFAALAGCHMPWLAVFELTSTLAILLTAVFAVLYGFQEARTFKKTDELEKYKKALRDRNTINDTTTNHAARLQSDDRLVAYADRLVDRQINKARGILPFNSIIMTVLSIERNRLHAPSDPFSYMAVIPYWLPTAVFLIILLALGLSSWNCLSLFLVRWGEHNDYSDFKREFDRTINIVNRRTLRIQWATVLSEASLFIGLLLVVMIEASVLNSNAQ